MPEFASVCWRGGLVVVRAGTRPPRENIVPLKTMTESETNVTITVAESIPGAGNHNRHRAGQGSFSWVSLPDHMWTYPSYLSCFTFSKRHSRIFEKSICVYSGIF